MNVIEVVAQEAGEPGAALPHLAEIIVGLVAFSVLVFIVGRYAWPMLVRSHDQDVTRLRDGMARAQSEHDDAQGQLERSRARLAEVDNEAARIRDDARADAERIKSDLADNASEEAERIKGQGRQSVDASRARTVSELRSEVGAGSVELARRIVAASLSDDTAKGRSVDSFLDNLDSMAGRSNGSANGVNS
ncbi:F0F1 ATP synthase subunit B [Actinomycetospora termitidis]|uniref:ATP synthase subunit b n=1 Tax=Actinomycetospora termitidis TaxID=3053470 RepID=A0ABT7MB63_9PSEU|nr:F0F1 ATP synthase subunit B [Actinomycetospora sp. Odt1-22]MDL5157082.1 F0F1 ATP synthase subunit B [Actinomycetospora sp. Odt1-22]